MVKVIERAEEFLKQNVFDFSSSGNVPRYWLWFASIVALSAIFRFWNLTTASLWMDEAISVGFSRLPVDVIMFDRIDNHPQLSFLVQKLWINIVPDTAYARVPSALVGIGTVAVLMGFLRDQVSQRAALIGGLMLALATGHIYYSQEARMYSFLVLGTVIGLWGAVGWASGGRLKPRTYVALYIFGALVAIYSHLLGLVTIGLVSGIALFFALQKRALMDAGKTWLLMNIVVFVLSLPWLIQIPANMGFQGLNNAVSIKESIWYYKMITGFPGLGLLDLLVTALYYLVGGLGLAAAWTKGQRSLALCLLALLAVYPVILFGLSLNRPLLGARTLIPATLAFAAAAGLGLSYLKHKNTMYGLIGVLALGGLFSSINLVTHPVKPENYKGAFALIDREGYTDAPVLTCLDMSAGATWETRPGTEVYMQNYGGLLEFEGPQFWEVSSMSRVVLRNTTAQNIVDFLGRDILIDGGIEEAFADDEKLVFIRPFCKDDDEDQILAEIASAGFEEITEALILDDAPQKRIIVNPKTRVSLFRRKD